MSLMLTPRISIPAHRYLILICLTVFCLCLIAAPLRADDTIILNITLNKESKGEYFVHLDTHGDFLLRVDDLKTIGIQKPAGVQVTIDGIPYINLKTLQGVTALYNEKSLSLELTASPEVLPHQALDLSPQRQTRVYYPDDTSAFVNYGMTYLTENAFRFKEFDLTNQVGIRHNGVLFLTDSLYQQGRESDRFTRLMSSIIYDDRKKLVRNIAGDFLASSGSLGSSVPMGGFSYSRLYQIDPYLITYPTINIAGMSTVPSEVDIYLNGVMIRRERFSPGPFELRNLASYAGAGAVDIVIRDAFGREERISRPFYISTQLLKAGLHEFSYNLGVLRNDYGIVSNSYSHPSGTFFHRYGITDYLSTGFRGEASNHLLNLGTENSLLFNRFGIATLGVSASLARGNQQGLAGSASYVWDNRTFSLRASAKGFDKHYETLSSVYGSSTEQTKSELAVGAGYTERRLGTISIDYSTLSKYTADTRKVASATYARNLTSSLTFLATLRTIHENKSSNEFLVFLNYTPDKDYNLSVQHEQKSGETRENIQLQKNTPLGEGLGYRAALERSDMQNEGERYSISPSFQYNTRHAILSGDYQRQDSDGTSSENLRLGISGSLVYIGNKAALARPVTDSFGIIKVGDLKDVRIYQNSQEMGKTGPDGTIIIPSLNSYYENQLALNDKDIPIDYALGAIERFVSPPFRSGCCISFPTVKIQPIIGRLQIETDGTPQPFEFQEIKFVVNETSYTTMTSRNGEFYLDISQQAVNGKQDATTDCSTLSAPPSAMIAPGRQTILISYNGKDFPLTFTVPVSDSPFIDIGTLTWVPPANIVSLTAPVPVAPTGTLPQQHASQSDSAAHQPASDQPDAAQKGVLTMVVHFQFDKTDLSSAEDMAALMTAARILDMNKDLKVELEAHTDQAGSDRYNLSLSKKRADRLLEEMLTLKIRPARIGTVSYFGKKHPTCTESDEECRQQNRRGIIRLVSPTATP